MSTSRSARSEEKAAQRRRVARRAVRALSRSDVRLAKLIKRVGPYQPKLTTNAFVALIGSIIHQQVSLAAGATILARLRDRCAGRRLSPKSVLALDTDALCAVGLSRQKRRYVRDVAEHFADGRLSGAKLRRMSDEDVITAATQVVGVGRWTAEMLLIFCLERPDVWPVDDLGLRSAVRNHLDLHEPPDRGTMLRTGEHWRPYRTYATWYLWRSLENPIAPAIS